jgi:hypothetical protein
MRLKFLQTTPSDNPNFPFQAGQVVDVDELSPSMRAAIASGAAVLVFAPGPEAAVVALSERAVLPRAKGRKA